MKTRTLKNIVSNRPLITINENATVFDAAVLMAENKVGSLIVEGHELLVGIFTERDLLSKVVAAGKEVKTVLIKEVMSRNIVGIEADKPLCHALHLMHQYNFRHVPVFENGNVIGIVSARDALGVELQQFECENKIAEDIFEILA